MKKLALECQKNIEETLKSRDLKIEPRVRNALISLQEGLSVCIAKVPSGKGFPFDLPAVDYSSKIILSGSFLQSVLATLKSIGINETILSSTETLKNQIIDFQNSGIKENIREIKLLFTNFVKLRKILGDEDVTSKQVKKKLTLFHGQLKKHQIRHPRLKIIFKRIEKFYNNLFHCYDDPRIPRTNLEIERTFNLFKRILRKRTGLQSRKRFFSHEGRALIQIENITSDYKFDTSENRFINDIKEKRLYVDYSKLKKQEEKRQKDKLLMNQHYQKKISIKKAGKAFLKLKDQIRRI